MSLIILKTSLRLFFTPGNRGFLPQVLTDLVYDPKHDVIYTVMATGDVLVFESGTNPCTANQLWIPGLPDECVLCLALVKLVSLLCVLYGILVPGSAKQDMPVCA